MADNTGISWADATWNPVIGCAKVAAGCTNCYAEKMPKRLAAMGQADYAGILDDKGRFNGSALPRPEKLADPLRWRKPRRIFVNSMSDLFHRDVPFTFIAAVFGVMAATPWHRYMVLTKRIDRAREFFRWFYRDYEAMGKAHVALARYLPDSDFDPEWMMDEDEPRKPGDVATYAILESVDWDSPLPNVELYVSGSTQADVDANVPVLLDCPAAFRGLSLEPQVERVDLSKLRDPYPGSGNADGHDIIDALSGWLHADMDSFPHESLDIVIQGGESGPGARPFDIAWARYTRDQCRDAGVLYHLKQLGRHPLNGDNGDYADPVFGLKDSKGADPAEWPEDLQGCQDLPGMEVAHAD